MKLLCFHARDLRLEAGIHGSPSKHRHTEQMLRRTIGDALPLLDSTNKVVESKNALLVFVCVENGDERIELSIVRNDVLRARSLLGVAEIVVGAFGHLSDNVAEPMIARRLIDDLVDSVVAIFPATKQFPFGWDKSLDLHVPLHHYNVSFKSYP